PDDELLEDRLVQAETLADGLDLLGARIVAGDDGRRIGRREPQHQEDEHRHDRQYRQCGEDPPEDIAAHEVPSLARGELQRLTPPSSIPGSEPSRIQYVTL